MLTAFRVMLLVFLAISFLGCISGNKDEERNCKLIFAISGVLFLLSFLT